MVRKHARCSQMPENNEEQCIKIDNGPQNVEYLLMRKIADNLKKLAQPMFHVAMTRGVSLSYLRRIPLEKMVRLPNAAVRKAIADHMPICGYLSSAYYNVVDDTEFCLECNDICTCGQYAHDIRVTPMVYNQGREMRERIARVLPRMEITVRMRMNNVGDMRIAAHTLIKFLADIYYATRRDGSVLHYCDLAFGDAPVAKYGQVFTISHSGHKNYYDIVVAQLVPPAYDGDEIVVRTPEGDAKARIQMNGYHDKIENNFHLYEDPKGSFGQLAPQDEAISAVASVFWAFQYIIKIVGESRLCARFTRCQHTNRLLLLSLYPMEHCTTMLGRTRRIYNKGDNFLSKAHCGVLGYDVTDAEILAAPWDALGIGNDSLPEECA